MLLVDFSSSAVASITAMKNELTQNEDQCRDLIRHVVLATLLSYRKKYGHKYGEMVICADGRKYWRKEHFPNYKCKRKKARENSDLPWNMIFTIMSEMLVDLREHFPYKIIHIDRAEADDCVAVMVKWIQENKITQQGIFEEPEPVLIIAADHDYAQLQKYQNVRQWSPMTKKFIDASTKDMKEGPIIHIVKGDAGDGVPNIFSDDNVFLDERRQKPVSAIRLEEFFDKGIDACRTEEEKRNWQRNVQLVSFDYIPEDLEHAIIESYTSQNPKMNRMGIFNYLIKHRCRLLLDEVSDF